MTQQVNIVIFNRKKSKLHVEKEQRQTQLCCREWIAEDCCLQTDILFVGPRVLSGKYATTQSLGMFNCGGGVGYIFVSASWVIGYAPPSLHESHVTT